MGKVKQLWEQEVEQIYEDFEAGILGEEEAVSRLRDRGLDELDAREHIQEIGHG